MNAVKLIGNVGKELNVKSFEGGKMASFSLATSETYLNKNNENVTNTQWHNIVVWGKNADLCETLVKKGTLLAIEGKIETKQYTNKENKTAYFTQIVAHKIEEAATEKKEKTFFL